MKNIPNWGPKAPRQLVICLLSLAMLLGLPLVLSAQSGDAAQLEAPPSLPLGETLFSPAEVQAFLEYLATQALEEGRTDDARVHLQEIVRRFPGSPAATQAGERLAALDGTSPAASLANYVFLYSGAFAWGTTSAFLLGNGLGISGDIAVSSLTTLLGLGAGGLWAWYQSREEVPSLGSVLWTQTIPFLLIQHFYQTLGVVFYNSPQDMPLLNVGAAVLGWTGSAASHFLLEGREPSVGQYAWFLYLYTTGGMYASLLNGSPLLNTLPGQALGAVFQGGFLLGGAAALLTYDSINWTWERTALTGLGGFVGMGASLLVSNIFGFYDAMGPWSNLYYLAAHAGGSAFTAWLTRGFGPEQTAQSRQALTRTESGPSLMLLPIMGDSGLGAMASLRF